MSQYVRQKKLISEGWKQAKIFYRNKTTSH